MTKTETIESLRRALLQKESSGDYTAYNADGQAYGGYQFQQPTWDAAASAAGYEQYVGADIRQVSPSIQDAVFVSYMSPIFDTFNGDVRYMANAHYAGIGAAIRHYNEGSLPTGDEGGYDSQNDYAAAVVKMMGNTDFDSTNTGFDLATTLDWKSLSREYGHGESSIPQQDNPDTQLETWGDKALNVVSDAVQDTPLGSLGQLIWGNAFHSNDHTGRRQKVTEDDVKYVAAALPGDEEAQRFVLMNARDREEMTWLMQRKLDERERKERISSYGWGWNGVHMVLNAAADPTSYIPMAGAVKAGKIVERTAGTITDVAKISRYANDSAFLGALPAVQQKLLLQAPERYKQLVPLVEQGLVTRGERGIALRERTLSTNLGRQEVENLRPMINVTPRKTKGSTEELLKDSAPLQLEGGRRFRGNTTVEQLPNNFKKYAEIGVAQAVVNVASEHLNAELSGKKYSAQDYALSAILGMFLGAGMSALGDRVMRNQSPKMESAQLASKLRTAESEAIKYAADMPLSNEIRNETRGIASRYHDKEYIAAHGDEHLKSLEGNQEVFVMSLEDAKHLGRKFGVSVDDKAKGFHVPNEDYTVLIKDNIKNPSVQLKQILQHERIGHSGMRNIMGDKAYDSLLTQIKQGVDIKDSVWQKARNLANSYDPEEVLGYALEHGLLKRNTVQSIYGNTRNSLKKQGVDGKLSESDIVKLINKARQTELTRKTGVHYNADGSTAFAGVKFSKDNLMNPRLWDDYFDLDTDVISQAQGALVGSHLVGTKVGKLIMSVGKNMEANRAGTANPFGVAVNSLSQTLKKYGGMLMSDERMLNRLGHAHPPADRMREFFMGRLMGIYGEYKDLRGSYMTHSITDIWGRKSAMEFDRNVMLAYNSKYAGHMNCPDNLPAEVWKAVDVLKRYNDEQVRLGMKSADMFGIKGHKNLIDHDWKAVDHEFRRLSDPDAVNRFIHAFPKRQDAQNFLEDYYRGAAKRGVIAEKIKRRIDKENDALPDGAEKQSTVVSDKMIDNYLDEHVPNAVKHMLGFEMHQMNKAGEIGALNFYKERVPIDTSTVRTLPSGNDFSFDNNLRNLNMDFIISRNASRFAGECAINNVFKNAGHLKQVKDRVMDELTRAVSDGKLDRSRAEFEAKHFDEFIDDLRGIRPQRDAISKMGAVFRILQNISYFKNGASMMFAQFGEVGGLMAYTGARGIFSVFKPLRKRMEDAKYGKITAQEWRDAEFQMFGESIEKRIWSTNFEDRVTRDALTESSLLGKGLRAASDFSKNLGKITSQVNMLGHMTDSMLRHARISTMGDMVQWAHGVEFSALRNPFSEAKLKGANITGAETLELQKCLRKYFPVDDKLNPVKMDIDKFIKEKPDMFWKMYELVQNQADRAMVNGAAMSNRNLLKDMNSFTRLLFQFKDYSLRAMNSQGMRAMTTRDADDFLAMGLSVATNSAAYLAKIGVTYATLQGMGAPQKAEEYWDKYITNEQFLRIAAFRSMLGSTISPLNDIYEATTGAPTIRTTVSEGQRGKLNDASDFFGNPIAQAPGIQTGYGIGEGLWGAYRMFDDTASRRDFKKFMNTIPLPNLIPWVQGVNLLVDQSQYPEKRPKGGN